MTTCHGLLCVAVVDNSMVKYDEGAAVLAALLDQRYGGLACAQKAPLATTNINSHTGTNQYANRQRKRWAPSSVRNPTHVNGLVYTRIPLGASAQKESVPPVRLVAERSHNDIVVTVAIHVLRGVVQATAQNRHRVLSRMRRIMLTT